MDQSTNKKRQIIASLAVLLVIAVIGGGLVINNNESDSSEATTTSQTATTKPSTTNEATTTAATDATYKDGEYSAEGDYNSPGGPESITVDVTVKDGIITATSADGSADGGTAQYHQQQFIEAFADEVIGKKIADLKLDRVAGSSLTTNGFNDAIEQIRSDAQA